MAWRLRAALAALALGTQVAPAAGDLLVGSNGRQAAIVRVDVVTGAAAPLVAAGAAGLQTPDGIAIGPDGDVYVCSEQGSAVLRFALATGAFRDVFVAPGSGGLNLCEVPIFGPDGNLYVSSLRGDAVLRYDGRSGGFRDVFVAAGSGGLDTPSGMVFGPDGDLYVSSTDTDQVLRYDGHNGAFRGAFVAAGSGGLDKPVGLAFGPDGDLYVSSLQTHEVLRYAGASGAFVAAFVPAGGGGLTAPYGLAFGPEGDLYVVSATGHQVLRYRGSDGAFVAALAHGLLLLPTYVAFTPATGCVADAEHACLAGGRFRVGVDWRTPSGDAGAGRAASLTASAAWFWFFGADNVEVVLKVLDACTVNGRFWVFASGLTDVATTITVTDTRSGAVRVYHTPAGVAFAPIQDTAAFDGCP